MEKTIVLCKSNSRHNFQSESTQDKSLLAKLFNESWYSQEKNLENSLPLSYNLHEY